VKNNLLPYKRRGLDWDEDNPYYINCRSALRELPLQAMALPNLARELQERYEGKVNYGSEASRVTVKRIHMAEVVPKRQSRA
jgi:hypothetical protein